MGTVCRAPADLERSQACGEIDTQEESEELCHMVRFQEDRHGLLQQQGSPC